jgi:hypothetical protein
VLNVADPAKINANTLAFVIEAWRQGIPLITDRGDFIDRRKFRAFIDIDINGDASPIPKSLKPTTIMQLKLAGFIECSVPRILEDNRWSALHSGLYPSKVLSVGLPDGAIEINQEGPRSLGNSELCPDFSKAVLDTGTNNAFVIANGYSMCLHQVDIEPAPADINAAPQRLATRYLTPSATPTNTNTQTT